MGGYGSQVVTITIGGRTFHAGLHTAAHLRATFKNFQHLYPHATLRVAQGCYHTGVAASAGTHDKDGVIDFTVTGLDWWAAQKFLRANGWAAWYRHTGSWAPSGQWHLHAVSLGCPGPVGVYVPGQVDDYKRHAFGLAGQHATNSDKSWFPPNIAATIYRLPPPKPAVDARPAVSLAVAVAASRVRWNRARISPTKWKQVGRILGWLKAEGCHDYSAWQRRLGYTGAAANGTPGITSLTRLAERHGYRVTK